MCSLVTCMYSTRRPRSHRRTGFIYILFFSFSVFCFVCYVRACALVCACVRSCTYVRVCTPAWRARPCVCVVRFFYISHHRRRGRLRRERACWPTLRVRIRAVRHTVRASSEPTTRDTARPACRVITIFCCRTDGQYCGCDTCCRRVGPRTRFRPENPRTKPLTTYDSPISTTNIIVFEYTSYHIIVFFFFIELYSAKYTLYPVSDRPDIGTRVRYWRWSQCVCTYGLACTFFFFFTFSLTT